MDCNRSARATLLLIEVTESRDGAFAVEKGFEPAASSLRKQKVKLEGVRPDEKE